MANYFVQWDIDIFDVASPQEAAEEAWKRMRDPDSIACVFNVREKSRQRPQLVIVDLQKGT